MKPPVREFQFHKGTIETETTTEFSAYLNKFQFHKGTIETQTACFCPFCEKKFQFHKGTIETHRLSQKRHNLKYFNSIKVRLKP